MNRYLKSISNTIRPYRLRLLGKEFHRFSTLLKQNDTATLDEIHSYQYNRIRNVLEIAYDDTDFYRDKYDRAGFNPHDFKSLQDIGKIPLLTKDEVRLNSTRMVRRSHTGKTCSAKTSGTTGTPLSLLFSREAFEREWATVCYFWRNAGYDPARDGRVEFRGMVDPHLAYEYFRSEKILRINILNLNRSTIDSVLKKISSVKFKYFHGYPSAIYKFCSLLGPGADCFQPRGIFCASEMFYPWQRERIQDQFPESQLVDFYGMAEHCAIAEGNGDGSYSFIPSYGFVEVDRDTRELIATGFTNDLMPFIRYRMTDTVGHLSYGPVDRNRMLVPVVQSITGRTEDFTYKRNGEMVPPAVVTFPFKDLRYVSACKLIQKDIDFFELLLEATRCDASKREADYIINQLTGLYGSTAVFQVRFEDKIPVDKSGKFKWIECEIHPRPAC